MPKPLPRSGQDTATRTGGQLLVDCLLAHHVDAVFCVPGESYLVVLDALRDVQDRIRIIVGRHEASVAQMAEAYGKLTGRPGICFVTRGPGACHAAIALHTAFQDATPMILFVGQVSRDHLGRNAFQEMDYRQLFACTTKWVTEIVDADRIPELVSRAFHVAVNGRPGPVVISIPEDMQEEVAAAASPAPYKLASSGPGPEALEAMQVMIEQAKRPLVVVGGGGWTAEACNDLRTFAERWGLPVANGFRRQDLYDNTLANYVGDIGIATDKALVDMLAASDLLIVIGERLGEATTMGYAFVAIPRPLQRLVHVQAGAEELGSLYEADLPINCSPAAFTRAAAALTPRTSQIESGWLERGRQAYERFSRPPTSGQPTIDVASIVSGLAEVLPANAVITNGAGLYTAWVHRYYQYRDYGSQLAPTSGTMGYGLPAALAAKVAHPDRPVVCFAGDGCFMMAAHELATAVKYDLQVIVVVIDNASYGSIRGHQERYFPGRVVGTDLHSPDFVMFARSFGAYAERIEATEEFAAAFERALGSGLPALLTFKQDIMEVLPKRAKLAVATPVSADA